MKPEVKPEAKPVENEQTTTGYVPSSSKLRITKEELDVITKSAIDEIIKEYGLNAFKGRRKNIAEIKLRRLIQQKKNKLLGQKADEKNGVVRKKPVEVKVIENDGGPDAVVEEIKPEIEDEKPEFEGLDTIEFEELSVENEENNAEKMGISFAELRKIKKSVEAEVVARFGNRAFTGKNKRNYTKQVRRAISQAYKEAIKARVLEITAQKEQPKSQYDTTVLKEGLGAESDKLEKDGLSEYLVAYANKYSQYYADGKGTKGKPHTELEIEGQRKLNAAMLKFIGKNAEKFASQESGVIDKEMFDKLTDPVSAFDIEEVASNEQVTMKLFEIMASGSWDDNGNKKKLTSKQLLALSSILVKVAERKQAMESKKQQEASGVSRTQSQTLEGELGNE